MPAANFARLRPACRRAGLPFILRGLSLTQCPSRCRMKSNLRTRRARGPQGGPTDGGAAGSVINPPAVIWPIVFVQEIQLSTIACEYAVSYPYSYPFRTELVLQSQRYLNSRVNFFPSGSDFHQNSFSLCSAYNFSVPSVSSCLDIPGWQQFV